jgi:putative membrane protein
MKPFYYSPFPRSLSVGFALTGLLGVTLTVDAAGPRSRQVSARNLTRGYAAEPLAANDLRPPERAFLAKAVETARQQLTLAQVGVSQSTNAEVRSHAQQLLIDYRALHDSLEALVRRKGGIAGAPVGGTSETYQKLVEKSGSNFDREFIHTLAQATDNVLALFEQVVADAKDADVRELAAAELPVLRGHRGTITELQKTLG